MAKWLLALLAIPLWAQSEADWKSVLQRLDRLERENRELKDQIKSLTERVGPPPPAAAAPEPAPPEPSLDERLSIQEQRVAEQAQTKVEASHRFPLRLTGTLLVNSFYGTRNAAGQDIPLAASPYAASHAAGATFRQTILGLEYYGPLTFWGAKVSGSLFLDFFNGTTESGYSPARLRTANLTLDWATRSLTFGLEKPIFNPREPDSLAEVGISPMTGAGNLWRWQPQVRFEQRLQLSSKTQLRAQAGLIVTSEDSAYGALPPPPSLEPRRPGLEGRLELAHHFDETRRLEIAPGFHYSRTHVAGASVPSQLVSLDWFANPWWSKLEFSGAFFHGQNVALFGALQPGFLLAHGDVVPVHASGGWGQLAFRPLPRLTFNLRAGLHDDSDSDSFYSYYPQRIGQNRAAAANIMYRLAPNVIWSLEALRIQTNFLGNGWRFLNRYDMALAYQF